MAPLLQPLVASLERHPWLRRDTTVEMQPLLSWTSLLLLPHAASLVMHPKAALSSSSHRRAASVRMAADVKFVRTKYGPGVSVELAKPLGLSLVESSSGATVNGITGEGSASACDKIKMGMAIVSLNGKDVSELGLDAVIEQLGAAESPVQLTFATPTAEAAEAAPAPAAAPVAEAPPPARKPRLEGREKVDAAFDKNFGSEEGFTKLVTKVQKTVFNVNTWKNPLWGGSLAFAVGSFPLLILVLAGGRL